MNQVLPAKVFLLGIVLSSLMFFPFVLDPTLTPRFLTLSASIGLVFYFLYRSESSFILKADLILLAYSGYSLFCCLSIFWSNTSSEALFESCKQLTSFFVFLLTYYALKKDHDYFLKSILKFSILLFAIIFIVIVYQFITLEDTGKDAIYLVKGFNGHKNLLSSFLFLTLFFLCMASYKLEKIWKIAAFIFIFFCLILLFFLKTKAVWLGLLVAIVLILLFYFISIKVKETKPKLKLSVLLISGLIILNLFFLNFLQPIIQKSISYTSPSDSSGKALASIKLEEERLVLWDKTFHILKKKPLAGIGMGNWQIYLPDATLSGLWRAEDLNYTFQRPHNDFLWILSETGIIGFNLFLLFLFSILFLLIRTLRVILQNKFLTFDILLCIGFISGYYVISFFDFPRERIEHNIWIHLILGLAYFIIKTHLPLKTYFSLKIAKPQMIMLTGLMLFISFTGLLRFNGEFFMRRVLIYKSSNRLPETISAGNSALSFAYTIDPTSIPIAWYTGNAKASLGRYEEAQKDFLSAYKLNPYNRNILNDLGSSYVFTNDVLRAKTYYEEATRISPRFDDPKLNLAAMYINAQDFKTADFWLKSLMHNSERRTDYENIVKLSLAQ